MKKVYLSSHFLKIDENLPITVREISDHTDPDVQKTIDNFNNIIEWDEMFTTTEVKIRLEKGHKLFIFYNEDILIGHFWFANEAIYFGETKGKYKKFEFPKIFGYNYFIDTTKHDYKKFSSHNYGSYCYKELFSQGYNEIFGYIDEWNRASVFNALKSGFTFKDW